YPGIYRGALDCKASQINVEMLLAAARAIANTIPLSQLTPQKVAPSPFDPLVVKNIAKAVIDAARKTGVANSR
ncbi:MAG: NAD-dependent malic enzyme, partial [Candidatus Micrarchaeota archaeon]